MPLPKQPTPVPPSSASTTAVVAEKPSVARDIARVLGADQKGDGYLHGSGYIVTWAIGHLVTLAQPHEIQPHWKQWRRESLPMLPDHWPLVVYDKTKDQFEVVRKILSSPKVARIVCATDAGREGELIFRYIYDAAGSAKPVDRLWISSLTADAIRRGFDNLKSAHEYDGLADAARGRSRADWLVGMNLSRAYTLAFGDELSVGRVQTPTLAMIVERELAVRAFVPEEYREVVATFSPKEAAKQADRPSYKGIWFKAGDKSEKPDQRDADKGDKDQPNSRLPGDPVEADAIMARARSGAARIASLQSEAKKMVPPPLYDLTELQRHANRLYGFSAQKTLDVAQALYERHKLLSYPRTDCRHLSHTVAQGLPQVIQAISPQYAGVLAPGTGTRPLGARYVDDAKITDHHAIIPTTTRPNNASLNDDERKLYDLVCRRLLSAWHDDYISDVTTVITVIVNAAITDHYQSTGTVIRQVGWKVLDIVTEGKKARKGKAASKDGATLDDSDDTGAQALPPSLRADQPQDVLNAESILKKTRPPKRLNDATLLTAMETAGKTLDEKELSDAMKDSGLGTPATRASIIEVLLKRGYVQRNGKVLEATDKGIRLIEVVHPEVKSPIMTGQWESQLKRIERGKGDLSPFLKSIEQYVTEVVGKVGAQSALPRANGTNAAPYTHASSSPATSVRATSSEADAAPTRSAPSAAAAWPDTGKPLRDPGPPPLWTGEPAPEPARSSTAVRDRDPISRLTALQQLNGGAPLAEATHVVPTTPPRPVFEGDTRDLRAVLHAAFGFAEFRANQEAVCRAVVDGKDVLLVMPTGAGKSLCYQLPGFALGGTTLVISPLIALMEDQVAKLKERGFAVERIHSGRDRAASRQACVDYLKGDLQFLFIAPERLRVPGFPEMLAKRKPSLIAIDEAHCISQWGHDFRPDYRTLGQHLPSLRPAPIIALTATATPIVQNDIAEQLGLGKQGRFIHGFRRDNIAIEVVEAFPNERTQRVAELLDDEDRRPAIVYAPTRKAAEALAVELNGVFPSAAYHAGLTSAIRQRVQTDFISGKLQVTVATIAFGMGIDKADVRTVVHTALPGSIESYYQEIGRAGRDGLPSRAVLMHSYADRHTHDFFLTRDYPVVAELATVYDALRPDMQPTEEVRRRLGMDSDSFEKAIDKLWSHGGAIVDFSDNVARGHNRWREPYQEHRKRKQEQLEKMLRYAEVNQCRMRALVDHFGDVAGAREPCGICDFCSPATCEAQLFRSATGKEREIALKTLLALQSGDERSTGKLHTQLCAESGLDRTTYEQLLSAMAATGILNLEDATFTAEGREIHFRKASITDSGLEALQDELPELLIKQSPESKSKKRRKGSSASKPATKGKAAQASTPADRPSRAKAANPDLTKLEQALRTWRMAEAKKKRIPAFRILTDRVLQSIATDRPRDEAELLSISGIGPRLAEKYGAQLLQIIERN